jgi:hypothetical protein
MYEGSCLCKSVRYEVTGELGDFGYCHCTSCRKASGSAHAANSPVDRARFRLLSGRETLREYESSPGKLRAFCGNCGSPIYAYLTASRGSKLKAAEILGVDPSTLYRREKPRG